MYPIVAEGSAQIISESFNTVISAVWAGIGGVVTTISTTPLLLIPVGLMFAGACIGLAKKLMGSRKKR